MVGQLIAMQNQFRMYHWQTDSHAQHVAFGDAYETLDGLVDNFVEVFQGKYGIQVPKGGAKIKLENLDSKPEEMINVFCDFLTKELQGLCDEKDTDLLNIRDEMLAVLNKTKYLLMLK
jgi:hypothetical protein